MKSNVLFHRNRTLESIVAIVFIRPTIERLASSFIDWVPMVKNLNILIV